VCNNNKQELILRQIKMI